MNEPLSVPLDEPAKIAKSDLFVVPHTIDAGRAAAVARKKICDGVLRPDDIANANIDDAILAYVPFWRLEVAVDGMHVTMPVSVSNGNRSIPIPMPGYRHRESVSLVIARRLFPYPPNHVERTRGHVLGGSTTHGGWHGIEIGLEDMVPFGEHRIPHDAQLIEADVTRAQAEREGSQRAERSARPSGAVYAKYAKDVRSAACCFFPLYIVRYTYRGHAAPSGGAFWVTVCGRSGKVVGGSHPSALRSVTRKVRNWLTFG